MRWRDGNNFAISWSTTLNSVGDLWSRSSWSTTVTRKWYSGPRTGIYWSWFYCMDPGMERTRSCIPSHISIVELQLCVSKISLNFACHIIPLWNRGSCLCMESQGDLRLFSVLSNLDLIQSQFIVLVHIAVYNKIYHSCTKRLIMVQ